MSTPLPLHIQLLGNFRLLAGDKPISGVNTPRLQSLLAYLVLHQDTSHLRQHLAFQLWPDSSESQARTNLRKLFFQLHRALPNADSFLWSDTRTIGWNPDAHFRLDVAELQQLLTHLKMEPLDLDALRQVVELYQGQLLPSCYDDWIAPLRQQLHQAVMGALGRLITLLENQRAYDAGIRYAQRMLIFDPLEEKTYQRLMRLYALEGDYIAALRVYQECVAVLQRELEVEPAAETKALYERLRQRDPALAPKLEQKLPQVERLSLVGRQREWQTLQSAWRKAMQGQAHFICIWGEAGIGKTRLAEELLDWVGQQGVLTAHTRSYQAQGVLAYAPITTLLRSPTLASSLIRLGANWLTEVSRLLPELRDEHPGLAAPQPMTESWQRQHFLEALGRAVLADGQPLLLVFDDLHWCDQETLEWLHYLLRFAPQARLLVVGTSRVEEVDNDHPLTALQLSLRREELTTEIDLAPLSTAEVATLARLLADHELTSEQTQQLYADTEGNPLFVVETVRAGLEQKAGGITASAPDAAAPSSNASRQLLPPKVYAVIRSRLTQLSSQAQKIVSIAAVIGRSFSFSVLAAAASTEEDILIDSLDELRERRILREQEAEEYDFSHDRIRDVAYAELSRARRRQLHRHVAQGLETVYTGRLDEMSGLLAEHYEQAGSLERALHYLQQAGQRATQVSAYRDALTFYRQAQALILSGDKTDLNQQLYNRILTKLADTHVFLEEYIVAQRLCEESMAWAYTHVDQQSLADSLRISGNIAHDQSEYVNAAQLYQQALKIYRDIGEQSREAAILNRLGSIAVYQGDLRKATLLFEQALVITKEISDRSEEARALSSLGFIAEYQDEYAKSNQLLQQALKIYQDIGERSREAHVLNKLGDIAAHQGEYAKSTQLYQQALEIFRDVGIRSGEAGALNDLGLNAFDQGEYVKAIQLLQQALTTHQEIGERKLEAGTLENLGLVACARGEYATANQLTQQALKIFQDIGHRIGEASMLDTLGEIACAQGEYVTAAQLHQSSLVIFRDINQPSREAKALNGLGWAASGQGRYAEAVQLHQQALAIFREIGGRIGEAKVLNHLGCITFEQQKIQDSRRYFCQALSISLEIGLIPIMLASLVGVAQVLIQENQKEQALQFLGLALNAPETTADTKKRASLLLSNLRTKIPTEVVATHLAAGKHLHLEQVAKEILQAER